MKDNKKRYYVIDAIRGFAVINMVLFHLLYDMVNIFGYSFRWYNYKAIYFWEQCICITFILISGVCWHFGSHQLKRGLTVFVLGCLITVVTRVFIPTETIWFGILSFLGLSMLVMIPLSKLLNKIPCYIGLIISLCLFLFTKGVNSHFLGFYDIPLISLPDSLYSVDFLAFLGFPGRSFMSSDYFAMIPWFFVFCFGYFLWGILKKTKVESLLQRRIPVLDNIGKYSLIIYVVHQPLIYGALYLITNVF